MSIIVSKANPVNKFLKYFTSTQNFMIYIDSGKDIVAPSRQTKQLGNIYIALD